MNARTRFAPFSIAAIDASMTICATVLIQKSLAWNSGSCSTSRTM
jgi:hypothetical protein